MGSEKKMFLDCPPGWEPCTGAGGLEWAKLWWEKTWTICPGFFRNSKDPSSIFPANFKKQLFLIGKTFLPPMHIIFWQNMPLIGLKKKRKCWWHGHFWGAFHKNFRLSTDSSKWQNAQSVHEWMLLAEWKWGTRLCLFTSKSITCWTWNQKRNFMSNGRHLQNGSHPGRDEHDVILLPMCGVKIHN